MDCSLPWACQSHVIKGLYWNFAQLDLQHSCFWPTSHVPERTRLSSMRSHRHLRNMQLEMMSGQLHPFCSCVSSGRSANSWDFIGNSWMIPCFIPSTAHNLGHFWGAPNDKMNLQHFHGLKWANQAVELILLPAIYWVAKCSTISVLLAHILRWISGNYFEVPPECFWNYGSYGGLHVVPLPDHDVATSLLWVVARNCCPTLTPCLGSTLRSRKFPESLKLLCIVYKQSWFSHYSPGYCFSSAWLWLGLGPGPLVSCNSRAWNGYNKKYPWCFGSSQNSARPVFLDYLYSTN